MPKYVAQNSSHVCTSLSPQTLTFSTKVEQNKDRVKTEPFHNHDHIISAKETFLIHFAPAWFEHDSLIVTFLRRF